MHPLEMVQIGLALLRQREIGKAIALAESAVKQYPEHGELWELLGVSRGRRGDFLGAVAALETATSLKPLAPGARFHLAIAYQATGRQELAVFLCRMLAENPATPDWLLPYVASRLGQWGEFTEALVACQTILQNDPDRHEAHFGVGFYLRRMGAETSLAAEAIVAAHRLSPDTPLYRVALASLWHEMGQSEDAYELLRNLPAGSLSCPAMLSRMATVFSAARDWTRRDDCVQRLSEIRKRPLNSGGEG